MVLREEWLQTMAPISRGFACGGEGGGGERAQLEKMLDRERQNLSGAMVRVTKIFPVLEYGRFPTAIFALQLEAVHAKVPSVPLGR